MAHRAWGPHSGAGSGWWCGSCSPAGAPSGPLLPGGHVPSGLPPCPSASFRRPKRDGRAMRRRRAEPRAAPRPGQAVPGLAALSQAASLGAASRQLPASAPTSAGRRVLPCAWKLPLMKSGIQSALGMIKWQCEFAAAAAADSTRSTAAF